MHASTDDDVSLRDLLDVLWRGRLTIVATTLVVAIAAGATAWLLPKKYQASVMVSVVSNSSGSGQLGELGAMASQFGGLASLAGLSIPGDSRKSESVAVLQSEALTEQYIRKNNLLPLLYREKWDAVKNSWKTNDPSRTPTLWKANQYFKDKVRSVSSDSKTGLVTLTITWTDPKLAAKWANDLVTETNVFLRDQAIRESERNIAYLNDQAAKSDAVGVRQAIYAILQSEINKSMLARGSDEYALKVIDPAVAPERAAFPKPSLWAAVGFALGASIAILFVFLRSRLGASQAKNPRADSI